MYPRSYTDKHSLAGNWIGKYGCKSIWQSNWIVQQTSQVLRTMESMASISVRIRLWPGSILYPANKNVDRLKSEVWTGQLQNRIIPNSRCPMNPPLSIQFRAW